MDLQSNLDRTKYLGHLALHYRAGDGERVVQLFRSLGLRVEDLGPARNGDRFLKVIVDTDAPHGDGYFFAATAAPAQLAFEDALTASGGAALEAYRSARLADPESSFHIGVRYQSLEALERAVHAVEAMAGEPDLQKRISVVRMKAPAGRSPEVDARMAASPVFKPDDREAFSPGGVQVFIQTDIVAGGLLAIGQTIELDYVFPGRHPGYPPVKVYEDA